MDSRSSTQPHLARSADGDEHVKQCASTDTETVDVKTGGGSVIPSRADNTLLRISDNDEERSQFQSERTYFFDCSTPTTSDRLRRADEGGAEEQAASGVSVLIREYLDKDFGLYVWPSSVLLAKFIALSPLLCKNKNVLELGAGTGLVGLTCAKLEAKSVVLSDHCSHTRVLHNLRQLVELNHLDQRRCTVMGLSWGRIPVPVLYGSYAMPDLIVGADLFYNSYDIDAILATIAPVFSSNPECVFLVSYQERGGTLVDLTVCLAQWDMEANPLDAKLECLLGDAMNDEQFTSIHLVEIRTTRTGSTRPDEKSDPTVKNAV